MGGREGWEGGEQGGNLWIKGTPMWPQKTEKSVAEFQESGVLYDQTLHFSENWILSQDLQLPVLLQQG